MLRPGCNLVELRGFGSNFFETARHLVALSDLCFDLRAFNNLNNVVIFIRGIDGRFKATGRYQRIDPFADGSMMDLDD